MSRVESPHSINVFRACPRRYFYRYHLKLPEKSGVAAVNGGVVHSALEQFFTIDPTRLQQMNAFDELRYHLVNAFHEHWAQEVPNLMALSGDKGDIKQYYAASLDMLNNFFQHFAAKVQELGKQASIYDAFVQLKPETEVHFLSESLQLQGYVDAIHKHKDGAVILDYKTSRSDEVTDEYRMQLALYAALFQEKFGVLPSKVGLYFLRKNTEKFVEVTQALVDEAVALCKEVHAKTVSKNMDEYPKNIAAHCRYCDFQSVCFGQKSLQEFSMRGEEKAKGLNLPVEADVIVGR